MRARAIFVLLLCLLLASCTLGATRVPFETIALGSTLSSLPWHATTSEEVRQFWGGSAESVPQTRLLVAASPGEVERLFRITGCADCADAAADAPGMASGCLECNEPDPETHIVVGAYVRNAVMIPDPLQVRTIRQNGGEVRLVAHIGQMMAGKFYNQAMESGYHVVSIPRDRLPEGSLTFVLVDESGKEWARETVALGQPEVAAD